MEVPAGFNSAEGLMKGAYSNFHIKGEHGPVVLKF